MWSPKSLGGAFRDGSIGLGWQPTALPSVSFHQSLLVCGQLMAKTTSEICTNIKTFTFLLSCGVYWDIWALFFDWCCLLPALQPTMNTSVVRFCLFFLLFPLFPVFSLSSFLQIKVPLSAGSFNFHSCLLQKVLTTFSLVYCGEKGNFGGSTTILICWRVGMDSNRNMFWKI